MGEGTPWQLSGMCLCGLCFLHHTAEIQSVKAQTSAAELSVLLEARVGSSRYTLTVPSQRRQPHVFPVPAAELHEQPHVRAEVLLDSHLG